MSKGTMIIFIVVLFVSINMIEITNATHYINYDPLKKNRDLVCSPTHPDLCKTTPANPYQRGCNPIDRCRGAESDDIIDNDEEDITNNDEEDDIVDNDEGYDNASCPAISPNGEL
ncbi:protein RALF-like 9 [Cucurbita moschata]|uniref:Protein RALF-like 9 n=1 Tax=Cucurbita moschata TaxID=3662 RepID=A0A6J1HAJ8_CUCMO|nr:protein RALF-like 9 [Cucurbita moschata]